MEDIVCKVRTQDPENLDEEVKSLVSAWRSRISPRLTECCTIVGLFIIFIVNLKLVWFLGVNL